MAKMQYEPTRVSRKNNREGNNMEERYVRTAALLGEEAVLRLRNSAVAVFGLGGVGGYTVEALARAGVGALWLFDFDTVSESNLNRQLFALTSTVGMKKTGVARARVADINPNTVVYTEDTFADESNIGEYLDRARPDFIVDAIDSVPSKIALILAARERNIPIISCMGTGNKLDPSKLQITDIKKTNTCPLAAAVRTRLRKLGVNDGVAALWSTEFPVRPQNGEEGGRPVPATVSYLPAVAGLMLGGYVIRKIAGIEI